MAQDGERSLAVFVDFENLALGFQNRREKFDITRVFERLVEKGKIVFKKAYADWNRFSAYTAMLDEAAIELLKFAEEIRPEKILRTFGFVLMPWIWRIPKSTSTPL